MRPARRGRDERLEPARPRRDPASGSDGAPASAPASSATNAHQGRGVHGAWRPASVAAIAAGAALLVAAAASVVAGAPRLLAAACLIGPIGMLLDSVLGATVQGRFHCDRCDAPTERVRHRCGADARRVAGLAWLGNDGVNAAATGAAAVAGWLAWRLLGR